MREKGEMFRNEKRRVILDVANEISEATDISKANSFMHHFKLRIRLQRHFSKCELCLYYGRHY
jgi:hypothetical protein